MKIFGIKFVKIFAAFGEKNLPFSNFFSKFFKDIPDSFMLIFQTILGIISILYLKNQLKTICS